MAADPHRRDKRSEHRQEGAEKADLPREANHVESPGHVGRESSEHAGHTEGTKGAWPNEGEGNKTADRSYRKGTEDFIRSGQVEKQARKAAEALDGDEGPDLRKAEDKGRSGNPRAKTR